MNELGGSAILKVAGLLSLDLLLLLPLLYRNSGLRVGRSNWVLAGVFAVIVAHYLLVGTSYSLQNNLILAFGFGLLGLGVILLSVLPVDRTISGLIMMMELFASAFVLANLVALLLVGGEAFVDGNFVGVTANANMLGGYAAILCVPPLIGACVNHGGMRKALSMAMLVLALTIVILSRSRAAILVVFAEAAYLLYYSKAVRSGTRLLLVTGIGIAAVLSLLVIGAKYSDATAFSTRGVLILQRFEAISERPWSGWGFNSDVFSDRNPEQLFPAMEKGNTLLQLLEEFGIPLGAIITLLIALGLARSLSIYRRSKVTRVAGAMLVGAAVHLTFETWLLNFFSVLSLVFWLLLMLANGVPRFVVTAVPRPAGVGGT